MIHLIINFDLLTGRGLNTVRGTRYRGFLLGTLAYYITDAAWGIFAEGKAPVRDGSGTGTAIGTREGRRTAGQYHILIVDDVPLNLAVLKALLKKIGANDVETAVDGQDAWDRITTSERPFDWVLTDIWMPKMDGRELVSKIRADRRFAGLPVYAVTADIEEKKAFAEHKFTGTLLKPLTIDKLSGLFQ